MQDPAAAVLDDEEAVEQPEGHRGHGEEIEGHDHLAVILEKGQPAFARVTAATNTSQIPGRGSLGDGEAGLVKFSVDSGGSPRRILLCHATVERADLPGDPGPTAARPRPPTPAEAEARAMPADDGFGLHDHQDVGPTGPDAAQGSPEEPGRAAQGWPRPSAFEYGDLPPEGKDFERSVASTAEEDADGAEERKDEFHHQHMVVACRDAAASAAQRLHTATR